MKKYIRVIPSALGITALLMGTATFTGCSSEENLTENNPNEENSQPCVIRARVSLDNATTRSTGAASNENGSWGYSEETGLAGYPFAWPDFAYEPNGKAVFSGIATTPDDKNKSVTPGDWYQPIWNETYYEKEYYAKIQKETNLLFIPFVYGFNSDYSMDNYTHVMIVYGRYGKELQASNYYTQAKYDLSESDIVSGKSLSFTQKGKNSIHLDDYVGMWAKGTISKAQYNNESYFANESESAQFTFHHLSTIFRFIVKNKRGQEVTINKVEMKESKDAGLFPASVVYGYADLNNGTDSTMSDPDVKDYSTTLLNSVAVNLDANGTTWNTLPKTDDKLAAYGLAICNPATDISTNNFQFVVTDSEGKEYTSMVLSGEKIKTHVNGAEEDYTHAFLPGYYYTFTLLMDENKLTLGEVTVNGWGTEINGGSADITAIPSLTDWCKDDTYQAQREALTTLTLEGASITADEAKNYTQGDKDYTYDHFKTYFPNVTTVNFTGTAINAAQVLRYNQTVKTIIGKDLVALAANALEANSATSYDFPNVETIGEWCFNTNSVLTSISLPKLKTIGKKAFDHNTALAQVCFASISDFTGASGIFDSSNAIAHLAFGTTAEMKFDAGKAVKDILGGSMNNSGSDKNTTLYLNEEGYEYKNEANFTNNTWRGIPFKAIKPYSEYPGKKD